MDLTHILYIAHKLNSIITHALMVDIDYDEQEVFGDIKNAGQLMLLLKKMLEY